MKKKILTFVLVLSFIVPCMIAFAGCGCNHANAVHGLCDCGHYDGITLTINESHNGINMQKDEKVYFRYQVEQGQHYARSGNKLVSDDIKYFAKYNMGWVEVTGQKYFDTLPKDGYVYIEITAGAETLDASINIYKASHSQANKLVLNGDKAVLDLDETASSYSGQSYCCMFEASAGRYLIFEKSDFVEFPVIYDSDNNVLNESLYQQGGNYYLTLEEATNLYFHFYFNTVEDSTDSHFTIQVVPAE